MTKEQVHITRFIKMIMVATGSWRLKVTNDKFIQTLYTIYSVLFQFSFLCFFLTLILNLPSLLRKQNFQLIAENVGYTIIVLVMLTKIVICQTSKIRNLIVQCIMEEKRIYKEDPKAIQDNFKENVKVLNRVNTVLLPLTISATSVFCIAKYSEYSEYKSFNITIDKPLPLPIWYPFNPNYYYGIAFIIGIYLTLVGSIYNVVTQALFLTLMTYAALQMKALKIIGVDFHLYCKPYNNTCEKEKSILAILRKICVKHQSIISFVDELNMTMKNVLLLEFLLNSLNIASVMVQIIIMPNTPPMLAFCVIFCILQISQLFVMSWHANEIEVQSISISDALFRSQWYEQSENAKKIISIILLRCRKPLRLFIGPFYPMTIRTALSTVKAAYSYVTLIFTLAGEK